MLHSFKKINELQKELTVELNRDELKGYVDRAENALGRDLRVDGFRKGKIPKDMLKGRINPAVVLESALDIAVKETMAKIIESENLDVADFSKLEIKDNTAEKLSYKVLLTLFPDIKIKDVSSFKVAKKDVSVEQKEIDDTLSTIKTSRAVLTDKNGPAEKGDRVEIDFEVKAGNIAIDGGVSKNHPLVLGDSHFVPGFEENLIGMKKDDEKAFSLVAPKDYYRPDMAGKKLDFSVKVKNVQTVRLPELNDEFAKSIGKFSNVSELVASVREGILQEKKIKEQQRLRLEILDRIIKTSDIAVPEPMVANQLNSMVQDFDNNLHANEMELGLYLAHIGKTQDDLKKGWRGEAEKQVKVFLVLHKIAKDKKIFASNEEIEQQLNAVVQSVIMRGGNLQDNMDIEGLKEDIAAKIINEKTLSLLEKTCVI